MIFVATVAVAAQLCMPKVSTMVPTDFRGKTVHSGPSVGEKVIALTFDDGPSPFTTPQVLATLKRYHAQATFFVVGEMVKGREKLLRRMVADGHVIGNHTFSHAYHPSAEKAAIEIHNTNLAVFKATGKFPVVFRPPGGFADSWTAKLAKSQGMPSVIWTGDSGDCRTQSSDAVYRNVIAQSRPGATILMHDIKPWTTAAVPRIMSTLAAKGYRFITVPEMLQVWQRARREAADLRLAANSKKDLAG